MIGIRIHGRGGQGARLASRIIGRAGFLAGLYAQDFPLFGAERRGAPIVACARLSRGPIETRGYIDEPDAVVVMDDRLLEESRAQIFGGLRTGAAVLVNARANATLLPTADFPGVVFIAINLSGIARRVIGHDTRSAVAAGAAARFVPEITAALLTDAIRAELADAGVSPELAEKNVKAAMECYALMPPVFLAQQRRAQPLTAPPQPLPFPFVGGYAASTIRSAGNAALRHTGNWRTDRPEIELGKCKKCFLCFLFCPEAAIRLDADLLPHIDYDHCKGCMICREECPTDAVAKRLEA